jgi:hypothetical protein
MRGRAHFWRRKVGNHNLHPGTMRAGPLPQLMSAAHHPWRHRMDAQRGALSGDPCLHASSDRSHQCIRIHGVRDPRVDGGRGHRAAWTAVSLRLLLTIQTQ